MTLTLHLTPELESRLLRYAHVTGKPAETVLADLLKALPEAEAQPTKRVLGLFAGQMQMRDDFNDELEDAFWFPEEKVSQE